MQKWILFGLTCILWPAAGYADYCRWVCYEVPGGEECTLTCYTTDTPDILDPAPDIEGPVPGGDGGGPKPAPCHGELNITSFATAAENAYSGPFAENPSMGKWTNVVRVNGNVTSSSDNDGNPYSYESIYGYFRAAPDQPLTTSGPFADSFSSVFDTKPYDGFGTLHYELVATLDCPGGEVVYEKEKEIGTMVPSSKQYVTEEIDVIEYPSHPLIRKTLDAKNGCDPREYNVTEKISAGWSWGSSIEQNTWLSINIEGSYEEKQEVTKTYRGTMPANYDVIVYLEPVTKRYELFSYYFTYLGGEGNRTSEARAEELSWRTNIEKTPLHGCN
ncbi:MAG: hypothetical protein QNK37_21920 [Acidobacteriota bacterium]|nr:hypothetical protein [Acidobacteriota bacterium]